MRRINTTQDQVSNSVALKLRLYFQMKEKVSQTKRCACRSAQGQTQQFLPCCHCMQWFNCNQKTINESQESVILSCESPTPSPPPLAQDQLTWPQNTVFFHLKSKESRAEPIHPDGWEETIRVAVTLTLRTA